MIVIILQRTLQRINFKILVILIKSLRILKDPCKDVYNDLSYKDIYQMFSIRTLSHNNLEQSKFYSLMMDINRNNQQTSYLYNRDSQQFWYSFNCIFLSCLRRENYPSLNIPVVHDCNELKKNFSQLFCFTCHRSPVRWRFCACMNFKTSHVIHIVLSILLFMTTVRNWQKMLKECCLSQFNFMCYCHSWGHVACQNLPWQCLVICHDCLMNQI